MVQDELPVVLNLAPVTGFWQLQLPGKQLQNKSSLNLANQKPEKHHQEPLRHGRCHTTVDAVYAREWRPPKSTAGTFQQLETEPFSKRGSHPRSKPPPQLASRPAPSSPTNLQVDRAPHCCAHSLLSSLRGNSSSWPLHLLHEMHRRCCRVSNCHGHRRPARVAQANAPAPAKR